MKQHLIDDGYVCEALHRIKTTGCFDCLNEDYTDIVEALGILSDQPTHKEVLVAIKSQAAEIKEIKAEVETVNNVNGRMCSQICDLEDEVEELKKSPWITDGTLPPNSKKVTALFFNPHKNSRQIMASYVRKHEQECNPDCGEYIETDYSEEKDCYYGLEGWYEQIENWGEFTSIAVCEGEIVAWHELMPIPDSTPLAGEKIEGTAENWENGKLGMSEEHARVSEMCGGRKDSQYGCCGIFPRCEMTYTDSSNHPQYLCKTCYDELIDSTTDKEE